MSKRDKLIRWTASANLWLKKVIGKDNELLFQFVRFLLLAILLALLVGTVVWIFAAVVHVVSIVVAALVAALPYLAAIAVVVGVVALSIYIYRLRKSKRRPEVETQREVEGRSASQKQAEKGQTDEGFGIQQSLRAADQRTRSHLENVLASLQRLDHRLEVSITPAHYSDLFGDNWVNVREFVESSEGRNMPEVLAKLLEIVILYKRSQDIRWVPINDERIHAWWGEASRRRKGLSDLVEGTAVGSDTIALEGEALEEPEAGQVASPKPSVPPTLDELLRYYEQINQNS